MAGRIIVEWVAEWSWNGWPNERGIRRSGGGKSVAGVPGGVESERWGFLKKSWKIYEWLATHCCFGGVKFLMPNLPAGRLFSLAS
ncbi:MAG: hypothetical protein EBT06_13900 [Gammaproteobacteria bacterium]|nr:hypothetical protein [Gammaproteobacteria bacterium]NBT45966.1 hypothetical protein [Gammaproteobacteria bacterium]